MLNGYKNIFPFDGKENYTLPFIEDKQINVEIEKIKKGSAYLAELSFNERRQILYRFAGELDKSKEKLAQIISSEMGKPIKQALGEAKKCADMARYFADNGEAMLKGREVVFEGKNYTIEHTPKGPILFIATWNNPLLQATLAVIPQIITGNSAIVKPAQNAPGCALAVNEMINEMALPEKIYWVALTSIEQTEDLLLNTDIKGVTFIGSTKVGHRVAELAGKTFKVAVIDAGGSDPMLVLPDADVKKAAEGAVAARFGNTGQSCIAAKRVIVHQDIYDEFLNEFILATKKLIVGNPLDPKTEVGPLATFGGLENLDKQVKEAINQGAKLIIGGNKLEGDGAFFAPTILAEVDCNMLPSKEEIFGPVASVYKAIDENEMIELANDTPFGLGASVYGENAKSIAEKITTGNVAINTKIATVFPVPFGGIKASGYGVYFGEEGLKTFANTKVYIEEL